MLQAVLRSRFVVTNLADGANRYATITEESVDVC
jgi:hypothetical protein